MAISIEGIELTYMQDFATLSYQNWHKVVDNMVLEQTYTLIDKRDNNEYIIAKLKDNRVWMCQNLRIINKTIHKNDSNIPVDSFTIPVSDSSAFKTTSKDPDVIAAYLDETYGGYYSWKTVVAGKWVVKNLAIAPGAILPKGWGLPSHIDWQTLMKAYGDSETDRYKALTVTPVPGLTGQQGYVTSAASVTIPSSSTHYWCSDISYVGTPLAVRPYTLYLDRYHSTAYVRTENSNYGCPVRGFLQEPLMPRLYAPLNAKTKLTKKLYCSRSGQTAEVKALYCGINGEAKLIYK